MNPLFEIAQAVTGRKISLDLPASPLLKNGNEPDPDFLTEDQIGRLTAKMTAMKNQAITMRRREEIWWELAWRFYHGDHWVKTHQNQIVIVPVVSHKPRITDNRIVTGVETRVAHLLKNRPRGFCVPRTTDEEDRDAARTGDKIVDYYLHALNLREKDWITQLWVQNTGNCFQKIYWDNSVGPKGPDGKPQGDPCIDVCFPYEVFPDPVATTIDDCQAFMHASMRPLWWVKKHYGKRAQDLSPSQTMNRDMLPALYAEPALSTGLLGGADRVNLVEWWQRPDEDYPDGLYAIFADDVFLAAMVTPKGYEAIPFVHYVDKKTAYFWGHSSARNAIEQQRQLNIAKSQLAFYRQSNRFKTLLPFESGISEDDWNDDDDEIVRFASGYEPKGFAPEPLPQSHLAEIQMLEKAISDAFGNADIMRGEVSGETRSGRMVEYQQEYAGTVLGLPAASIELGEQKRVNMLLKLVKTYASDARYISYVGRDREIETIHFQSSDLEGISDYVVEVGSAIPKSLSSLRDNAVELMKSGAIPVKVGLRMMDTPSDLTEMMEEEQPDRDRANEENAAFLSLTEQRLMEMASRGGLAPGHPPSDMLRTLGLEPRDFEDQQVHIEEHDKDRKGRRYRQLPLAAQKLFDAHVDWHKAFVAAKAQAQSGPLPLPSHGADATPPPIGGPTALMPGAMPPGGGVPGVAQAPTETPPPPIPPPHK